LTCGTEVLLYTYAEYFSRYKHNQMETMILINPNIMKIEFDVAPADPNNLAVPDHHHLPSPIMTETHIACRKNPSDDQIPRSILRAMDGAKDFLHASLLKVPWLWRMDSVHVRGKGDVVTEELRNYGKIVRSQINVIPFRVSL